mgnify:CR=1 FL=1
MRESYLSGYELDARPNDVNIEHANKMLLYLVEQGCSQIGSCVTADVVNIKSMLRMIESARDYSTIKSGAIPGPLVLNGNIIIGNAIGVWE